jgi:hypothetical protein
MFVQPRTTRNHEKSFAGREMRLVKLFVKQKKDMSL